jgi:beta-phosphoglucomutase-like phosphatase (HAD superfamily)
MLVSPDECLVVEDSETGVQAARQAGMNVLGFIKSRLFCAENEEKLLKAGAFQVFCEMKELPDIIHRLSSIEKNLG